MAGRKQINANQRDQLAGTASNLRGWLVWWSITEAERTVDELKTSAINAALPTRIVDRISGRTSKTAWLNATQLGAKGYPSRTLDGEPKGSTARYLIRDLKAGESRALVREVIDGDGETVDSYQVATLYFLNDRIEMALNTVKVERDSKLDREVRQVIGRMQGNMADMMGKVDDGRIRAILLDWLVSMHRICVRGTGGVYFVPRPQTGPSSAIQEELISLRSWINSDPINSSFSIVDVSSGGSTTIGDFTKNAIDEMKEEIHAIHDNLRKWANHPNMNAGSKMYSSQTMIDRADQAIEKATYLQDALGEELAVVVALAAEAKKAAVTMNDASTTAVNLDRAAKKTTEAEPVGGSAKDAKTTKKSGTAKTRNSKVAVE
jgi:hypothetical protein